MLIFRIADIPTTVIVNTFLQDAIFYFGDIFRAVFCHPVKFMVMKT
ncbi:Uncharacterised protein [Yersinia similis]|nr:Uncharacterised protein [Yersinia similis]